jgi:energy-coupling factor transporter ATP-binding protein EcfA2
VARALINEPSLLPADEPTRAPDADSRDPTTELLSGLPRHYSCGPLVVTHDPDIAARADRTQRLSTGVLEQPSPGGVRTCNRFLEHLPGTEAVLLTPPPGGPDSRGLMTLNGDCAALVALRLSCPSHAVADVLAVDLDPAPPVPTGERRHHVTMRGADGCVSPSANKAAFARRSVSPSTRTGYARGLRKPVH